MYSRAKYKEGIDWKAFKDPVGSKKYDGAHYFLQIDTDGSPRFFSRRESVKGNFPERTEKLPHLTDIKLPHRAGEVYSVELIHTGHEKEAPESHPRVSGILNSLKDKAIQTQKITGPVRAVLLDVIQPKIATYGEKLEHLKSIERDFGKSTVLFVPDVKITKNEIEKLLKDTKDKGEEGVVITSLSSPEDSNIRAKIKHFNTYNLRITGITREFTIGGDPKNSAGALELSDATGKYVGNVGTGFTRDQRIDIFENPNSWMNKLVQVKAMPSVGDKLRMAVFNGEADGDIDTI